MKIITSTVCLLLLGFTMAQSGIDSLTNVISTSDDPNIKIEAIYKLTDYYQNPNDKLIHAREAYRLSESASDKSKIMAANKMGVCHGMLGQIDSSRFYFSKALEASLALGDSSYISSAYNGLGNLARISGDLDESLENFLDALDYADAVPKPQWKADILTNISGVHYDLKNYEAALEKVQEARDIYDQLDDDMNISYTANLLAILYRALGDLDKAYTYNQDALELLLVLKDTTQIIYNYVSATEILIEQNRLAEAADQARKTADLADQFGERDPHITSLLTLSNIYFRQGRINEARKYVDEGIAVAKKFNFNSQLPNAYMMKSLIEAASGNYKSSYSWAEKRESANDSLRSKEITDRISELEVQYETEKKESEIERLNAEQEIKELELQQARTRNIFLLIITALFLIIGLIVFYLYRQRIKINRQLQAVNNTKDRLFSMIAHDIKNPLSAFKAIATALEENYKSMPEDQVDYFISQLDASSNKLLDLLQNLLEWSITESGNLRFHPERVSLRELAGEAVDLFQGAIEAKSLKVENKISENDVVTADYKMLFSIIRNLISNAVKFTPNEGTITLESRSEGQLMEVAIADTGDGMTADQIQNLFEKDAATDKHGTGLGLVICKEFVEKNGGRIWVESEKGKGTQFKFTIQRAA